VRARGRVWLAGLQYTLRRLLGTGGNAPVAAGEDR